MELRSSARALDAVRPERRLARQQELAEALSRRLFRVVDHQMEERKGRLERLRGLLRALGPESAFERGFSITLDGEGRLVRSVDQVAPGDELRTKLRDGELRSEVRRSGRPEK